MLDISSVGGNFVCDKASKLLSWLASSSTKPKPIASGSVKSTRLPLGRRGLRDARGRDRLQLTAQCAGKIGRAEVGRSRLAARAWRAAQGEVLDGGSATQVSGFALLCALGCLAATNSPICWRACSSNHVVCWKAVQDIISSRHLLTSASVGESAAFTAHAKNMRRHVENLLNRENKQGY